MACQPDRPRLRRETADELLGYGPIQPLLDDPVGERGGRPVRTEVRFDDNDHVRRVIDRSVLPLGRRVAIDGPSITIRKFATKKLTIDDLVRFGSLTPDMAEFLRACGVSRLNLVVSGGTGSSKTTLLNVLSGFIPEDERIVTIEASAELQLSQDHVVRLETKTPNADGRGSVSIRDLVRNALRMRPDRIVVGETLDMLQAMNTGHDGSLTTLHANARRDALARMETMALMAGLDMPLKVIREQIASDVDVIVQQTRLRDGRRRITAVTEVAGMEGDGVVLTDVFRFVEEGEVVGQMKPTGIRPLFITRLEAKGFRLPPETFGADLSTLGRHVGRR